MFANRKDAAMQLAQALEKYRGQNVVVLGIPRGGAETAYYVARYLDTELSLLISRKLGHPGNPEFAFGALAEDGTVYLNPGITSELSKELIDESVQVQKKEIERRINLLRKGKPLPELKNKTVILVDDGIATGATIFAAIRMCRNQGAGKIVVAAPVSSSDKEQELQEVADETVILKKPAFYYAVSQAYNDFSNLSDQEALTFMELREKERAKLQHENEAES